jgi:hypothetical protein
VNITYSLVKMQSKKRADCSVVALAAAAALSYDDAEARLTFAGRKPRRRVPGRIFEKLGFEARPDLCCMTVSSALQGMQSGRFVVYVAGHFFAVVDGRCFDSLFTPVTARVKMVYEMPLDNPAVTGQYPWLHKIVELDKLPDMRALNCDRV